MESKEIWVTQDKDGTILAHTMKPVKNPGPDLDPHALYRGEWFSQGPVTRINKDFLPEDCTPKWEDEKPIQLSIVKAK